MDREEYPVAADGGAATATCIPDEGMTEPPERESPEAPSVRPDAARRKSSAGGRAAGNGQDAAQIVEALLFASDAPLTAARLSELSGVNAVREVKRLIGSLNARYESAGLTFRIEEIARGYQMLTLPAYQPWLSKLEKHRGQTRLSGAALEALSIVAYKQPVIRADIEAIRGVACGEVLNRLREMGLVKIVGRAEIVGRPLLYGTTRRFLEVFGLSDLEDLPPMEALSLRRPTADADAPGEDGGEAPPPMAAAGA
jgi:segregation and condensation protein B